MGRFSFAFLALAFGASSALAGFNHAIRHDVHDKIARSQVSGNVTERGFQRDWKLHKRFDEARFTYYKAGQGACGDVNGDGDFIVAMNAPQFDSGNYCHQSVTITYNGKSVQAIITDRCAGCPYGALDFTEGLFTQFASTDAGTIYGSWSFGSGESSSSTTSPTSTSQSSTSTWSPTSTSSSTSSVWSSSSTWSSTSSSTSSSTTTSSSTSSSATPSATPAPNTAGLIDMIDYGVVQLGGLIAVAGPGLAQVDLQASDSS